MICEDITYTICTFMKFKDILKMRLLSNMSNKVCISMMLKHDIKLCLSDSEFVEFVDSKSFHDINSLVLKCGYITNINLLSKLCSLNKLELHSFMYIK